MDIKSSKTKFYIIFVIALFLLCAVAVVIMFSTGLIQRTAKSGKERKASDVVDDINTVVFNGKEYLPKDLETYLVVGLDTFGEVAPGADYRNNKQADFLMLIVVDNKAKEYSLFHINRDTITTITEYGIGGVKIATTEPYRAQIALSHTYGDGERKSGGYVKDTVSSLLFNLKINHFVTMTMSGVEILNDFVAVNGLTVTLTEDLTSIDPTWKKGETIRLRGSNALDFVRQRKGVGEQTNLERMSRQRQYITAFLNALPRNMTSSWLSNAYDAVSRYIFTDCTVSELKDFLSVLSDYDFTGNIYVPEGEPDYSGENAKFYVDGTEEYKQKLINLVCEVFYYPREAKKK